MKNTNVDEMLLQMIEPKIKEIQEKFSRGEGLGSDDINTLLLKSQFNHINHLDDKLNNVTDDVAPLKGEFNGLKGEFKILESELKVENQLMLARFNNLESELKSSMKSFESNIEFKIQKPLIQICAGALGS
ncbi:MAG: hypothetical protein NW207_01435 [Cytophagales bacterium]|nr:hypothetical protein [Cytophagales bacterium]